MTLIPALNHKWETRQLLRLGLNMILRVIPDPDLLHPLSFAATKRKKKEKKKHKIQQFLRIYRLSLTVVKMKA